MAHPGKLILFLAAVVATPSAAQDAAPAPSPAPASGPGLFDTNSVLSLRISADFKGLMDERDSTKLVPFPATISYTGADGQTVTVNAELKLRGHWRRQRKNCEFAPLKVDFPKGARDGTIFEGQGDLKLVTHCRRSDEFQQYVLREYLVYQVYNILTPVSLRARLVRAQYLDSQGKVDSMPRFAFFIENEKKAAERNQADMLEIKGATWDVMDAEHSSLLSAFQYLVGATDWSVVALHNIVLYQQKQTGSVIPLAYDFDWTGIVNTRYAFPDYRLPIKTVRERLYRGICRRPDEWAPILARFNDNRSAIYGVYERVPELDPRYVKQTREYLDDFYKVIADPRKMKQELIDTCKQA